MTKSRQHFDTQDWLEYYRLNLREVQAQIAFLQAQMPTLTDKHRRTMTNVELSGLRDRESYLKNQIKIANQSLSEQGTKQYDGLFREVARRKLEPAVFAEIEQITRSIRESADAQTAVLSSLRS